MKTIFALLTFTFTQRERAKALIAPHNPPELEYPFTTGAQLLSQAGSLCSITHTHPAGRSCPPGSYPLQAASSTLSRRCSLACLFAPSDQWWGKTKDWQPASRIAWRATSSSSPTYAAALRCCRASRRCCH